MKTIQNIQRVESAVILTIAVAAYFLLHFNWLVFVALLLVPDISMVGYLGGNKIGGVSYNFMHSYVIPLIFLGVGIYTHSSIMLFLSLIWLAHIGFDRAMGYGLKLGNFKETHLGYIGKK